MSEYGRGPAREGFFEPDQYEAVRRHLSEDLQVAVAIAYTFGWRMQSEILMLERRHVDLDAGTLRLDPGMTKNDDGHVAYLTPELRAALVGQLERVKALERRLGRIVPYVFPHRGKGRRRDFRRAWATACTKAGLPGRHRHDFRRTAVRNMERHSVCRVGAQNRERLSPLRHRERCGPARGRAPARGHISGHSHPHRC